MGLLSVGDCLPRWVTQPRPDECSCTVMNLLCIPFSIILTRSYIKAESRSNCMITLPPLSVLINFKTFIVKPNRLYPNAKRYFSLQSAPIRRVKFPLKLSQTQIVLLYKRASLNISLKLEKNIFDAKKCTFYAAHFTLLNRTDKMFKVRVCLSVYLLCPNFSIFVNGFHDFNA